MSERINAAFAAAVEAFQKALEKGDRTDSDELRDKIEAYAMLAFIPDKEAEVRVAEEACKRRSEG